MAPTGNLGTGQRRLLLKLTVQTPLPGAFSLRCEGGTVQHWASAQPGADRAVCPVHRDGSWGHSPSKYRKHPT